jgi:hypothetical protein
MRNFKSGVLFAGLAFVVSSAILYTFGDRLPIPGYILKAQASSFGQLSYTQLHANDVSVNGAGTVYTLTASDAAITWGTTSPAITIAAAGTWMIQAAIRFDNSGATYAADRTINGQIERTNNTPAVIGASGMVTHSGTVTTVTNTAGFGSTVVIYTTANTNDALALFASVSVLPTAGITFVGLSKITATRLY